MEENKLNSENELDRLFQSSFEDFAEEPSEKVWENVEAQINNSGSRKGPFWIYGSLMLLLLIGGGFWYFNNTSHRNNKNTPIAVKEINHPSTSNNNAIAPTEKQQTPEEATNQSKIETPATTEPAQSTPAMNNDNNVASNEKENNLSERNVASSGTNHTEPSQNKAKQSGETGHKVLANNNTHNSTGKHNNVNTNKNNVNVGVALSSTIKAPKPGNKQHIAKQKTVTDQNISSTSKDLVSKQSNHTSSNNNGVNNIQNQTGTATKNTQSENTTTTSASQTTAVETVATTKSNTGKQQNAASANDQNGNNNTAVVSQTATPGTVATVKSDSVKQQNATPALVDNNVKPAQSNKVKADTTSAIAMTSDSAVAQTDSTHLPVVTNAPDSGKKALGILSRFYIAGIFSPDYSSRKLVSTGNSSGPSVSDYNKHEKPQFAYTAGLKIGYNMFKNWSVQSGVTMSSLKLVSKPWQKTINIAVGDSEQEDASFNVSSETIELPSTSFNEGDDSEEGNEGDSVIVLSYKTIQTINFVNIPLNVCYRFHQKKLSYYVMIGFDANVITKEDATIAVVNTSSDKRITQKMNNMRTATMRFTTGFGAQLNIFKGLYISMEPAFRASIISINKNNPIKSYPYSMGLSTGIGYHF